MKAYGPESLDEGFRESHSEILSIKRGNGLWLWKPYVILKALESVREGDYVFYLDSGAFFMGSVIPLIDSMGNSDVWVSDIPFVEEQWTKPSVFESLGITDEAIKNAPQVQASFVLVRKSEASEEFIREWLNLCERPELIMPLEPGEYSGACIEHREDQSLLSLLCKIRGIKPHKNPSVMPKRARLKDRLNVKARLKNKLKKLMGNAPKARWPGLKRIEMMHDDDKYTPCIYHHRIRDAGSMNSVLWQAIEGMMLKDGVRFLFRCCRQKK